MKPAEVLICTAVTGEVLKTFLEETGKQLAADMKECLSHSSAIQICCETV